jgi:hypothetical protein
MGVLKRVCEGTPTPIRETNPEVPDWLVAVVERLHAKEPAERFESAAEVAEVLGRYLAHVQHPTVVPLPAVVRSVSRPPAGPRQAYRKWWAAAAAVLVALFAALGMTEATGVTNIRTMVIRMFAPEGTLVVETDVVSPTAEREAFVLLGGKGVAERKFDTLAEAVLTASDGDTIEVRSNGPFVTEPIGVGRTALTIRAGAGFRPVIKSSPAGNQKFRALLATEAPLILEGLEIQRIGHEPLKMGDWCVIVYSHSGPLYAANCRFVGARIADLISSESALCELRNCEFLCRNMWAIVWDSPPDARLVITNCLLTSHILIGNNTADADQPVSMQLTNNTLVARTLLGFTIPMEEWQHALKGDGANKVLRVKARDNVLVADSALTVSVGDNVVPASEAEAILAKGVGWKGEGNLFSLSGLFLNLRASEKALVPNKPLNNLADWKQFWSSAESGTVTGEVRFQHGSLPGKLATAPEAVTPDDFRLRAESAGYRAGKDGKDLGADIELVGPGSAYERWKKTPEYQQWLNDTTRLRTKPPEPAAFALLGGKEVTERKFDTLAEAVQNGSAGDTIEVRGNGPFITEPIDLGRTALTIRAGAGYRPVIKSSPDGDQKFRGVLQTDARLILEGLEIHRLGPEPLKDDDYSAGIVYNPGGSLQAANCRFVGTLISQLISSRSALCELRNCEFLGRVWWSVVWDPTPDSRLVITNGLLTRHVVVGDMLTDDKKPSSIQLTNNTAVAATLLEINVDMKEWRDALKQDGANKVLQMKAAGNVLVAGAVVGGYVEDSTVPASEVQAILAKGVGWNGEGNVFSLSGRFLGVFTKGKELPSTTPFKDLADWKRFWGTPESGSVTGQVRFQRGNLPEKIAGASEAVTPDDFRLRPDSAGFRAGKDGKDVGADIDLVGPGPAYERWQKTPDYQQWLKDTGQFKK